MYSCLPPGVLYTIGFCASLNAMPFPLDSMALKAYLLPLMVDWYEHS